MQSLKLDTTDLASHVAIYGDTGSGKTTFLKRYLKEVERRGDVAVVIDPDREFARAFRKVDRGDWMLDFAVDECPSWRIGDEVENEADAMALATCQFPDDPGAKDPFWNISARAIYAYLLGTYKPGTQELGYWMARDKELDRLVVGTEFEAMLTKNAAAMRGSIIGHLNTAGQPLRMMPEPDGRKAFTIREWCKKRDSWIFITSRPEHAAMLKPLHTMWMASLIMRTISMGRRDDLPRVHFIFEEASSLVIQEFHMALVRLRKTNCPVVYAIQNFADLEAAYGKKAETIYSQPKTKIIFRTSNPDSAKKLEATVGQKLVWRMDESQSTPGARRSYQMRKEREAVIPQEQIMGWADRCGVLLQPGVAVPFKIPIIHLPDQYPPILDREIPTVMKRPEIEAGPQEIV